MEWISVSEQEAPKTGKFLFSYHYGIGIGEWANTFQHRNGDSFLTDVKKYILILWPSEILQGCDPMEWDNGKMIEMEVHWMPLPNPPEKDG